MQVPWRIEISSTASTMSLKPLVRSSTMWLPTGMTAFSSNAFSNSHTTSSCLYQTSTVQFIFFRKLWKQLLTALQPAFVEGKSIGIHSSSAGSGFGIRRHRETLVTLSDAASYTKEGKRPQAVYGTGEKEIYIYQISKFYYIFFSFAIFFFRMWAERRAGEPPDATLAGL